jgi:hypothetical protein
MVGPMSSTMLNPDQRAIEPSVHRLHERMVLEYAGRRTPTEVDAAVENACRRYDGVRVRQFVLVLVERAVREQLGRRRVT